MTRDTDQPRGGALVSMSRARRRRATLGLSTEPLEERRLLALTVSQIQNPLDYQTVLAQSQSTLRADAQAAEHASAVGTSRPDPPASGHRLPKSQRVFFGNSVYMVSLSGPGGVVAQSSGHRGVVLTLLGTEQSTQVTVTLTRTTHATHSVFLPITKLNVQTGQLGSFQALNTADLVGSIAPLKGTVGSLQFDAIDSSASIVINGSLGGLSVAQNVDLGPTGQIHVTGAVTGPVSIGGALSLNGGQIQLDRDLTNTLSVAGDVNLSNGGRLNIGRDLNSLQVGGNVTASSHGVLNVGRNLGTFTVTGNIDTSGGGSIVVGGEFNALMVSGTIRGKGSEDIVVGLDLLDLAVSGGIPGQGSLDNVNLDVAKNIQGMDISHGIFNSLITAGVKIDGGKPKDAFNIGPDGSIAVFDSLITAGGQITNMTISGDVESDRPTNPSGGLTRIVAGEDKAGDFSASGNIDNFQITGRLINAVVAASVAPFGGNGQFTTVEMIPSNGSNGTYDPPAGTITGTFGGQVFTVPNFTAPPFNTTIDPNIDNAVMSGSINMGLAPSLALNSPPFPTKSTVLGGVFTTGHANNSDYAGLFAADTRGVFVGILPR